MLLWSIVSIFNRLAIFASIGLFGKCLMVFGFYNIIFTFKKNVIVIGQYLFFLSYILLTNSIPTFSLLLVVIDTILELLLQHHFIQQLLVTTQIKFNLQTKNKIAIAKKIFQFQHQETIQYRLYLPKAFLTKQEKVWLQGEIERYFK